MSEREKKRLFTKGVIRISLDIPAETREVPLELKFEEVLDPGVRNVRNDKQDFYCFKGIFSGHFEKAKP